MREERFKELVTASQQTNMKAEDWRDGFVEQSHRLKGKHMALEKEQMALEGNMMHMMKRPTVVLEQILLQRSSTAPLLSPFLQTVEHTPFYDLPFNQPNGRGSPHQSIPLEMNKGKSAKHPSYRSW